MLLIICGVKLFYLHVTYKIEYDTTPYELWKGYKPNLKYLKVWRCHAKVLLPEPKKRK